jgi:hypothetical protein
MDILFSVYMIGAIAMFCFVVLCMLLAILGGAIPWSWFIKAIFIAATWPIMLGWGLASVVYHKVRT